MEKLTVEKKLEKLSEAENRVWEAFEWLVNATHTVCELYNDARKVEDPDTDSFRELLDQIYNAQIIALQNAKRLYAAKGELTLDDDED